MVFKIRIRFTVLLLVNQRFCLYYFSPMDEDLPVVPYFLDSLWDEEATLGGKLIRKPPKRLDREEIAKSIVEVFHATGGVARLAYWANEYYGLFATKLLPKVLPQASAIEVNNSLNITYQASIPPSALDQETIIDVT